MVKNESIIICFQFVPENRVDILSNFIFYSKITCSIFSQICKFSLCICIFFSGKKVFFKKRTRKCGQIGSNKYQNTFSFERMALNSLNLIKVFKNTRSILYILSFQSIQQFVFLWRPPELRMTQYILTDSGYSGYSGFFNRPGDKSGNAANFFYTRNTDTILV